MEQQSMQDIARGLSVGIIMDGNGRWAQSHGLPRTAGHKKGADVLDDITRYANELGVAAITFYAFSTENWSRPPEEIEMIMELFGNSLKKLYKYRKENNRVVFLGDRAPLKPEHQQMMDDIETETAERTGMVLNIAVNYGSRQELLRATRLIAEEVRDGKRALDTVDESCIEDKLYTKKQPMLDFVLRTSGEMRLSNFMLWQAAYAELLFVEKNWPAFTRTDFDEALMTYHHRNRRFGGL